MRLPTKYLKKKVKDGSIGYINIYRMGRISKDSKREKDGVVRFSVWQR